MNKIKSQIKFSWRLSVDRIISTRTFTLLLLLGFVYHIFLAPLNDFIKSVQHPLCPLILPFLLSDIYFLVLFMACVVYYYSDAPFMKNWTMYQVIRTGRVRWAVGQIGMIIISSFTFVILAIVITGVLLLPDITLGEGWGKVLYTLSMTGMSGDYNIPFSISYEIISRYTVLETLGVTILIDTMVVSFIGILMFCVSLFGSRLGANILAMVFVIMPMVQQNIGMMIPELAFFSPVSWMRLSKLSINGTGDYPTLNYCIIVLGIACILLSIAVIWKIKMVDFKMEKDD